MGQNVVGALCIAISMLLVFLHVRTALKPPGRTDGREGVGDLVGTLADKAPHLAGALAFMVLGLVVLGWLQLDLNAAAG